MKVRATLIWHQLTLFCFPNGDRLIIRPPWLRLKYMFQCLYTTSWWTWPYWAEGKAESLLVVDLLAHPQDAPLAAHKSKDQSSWWETRVWFAWTNYKGEHGELSGRKMDTFSAIQKWKEVDDNSALNGRGRLNACRCSSCKTNFKLRLAALCRQLFRTSTDVWPATRAEQNEDKNESKLCQHTLSCL